MRIASTLLITSLLALPAWAQAPTPVALVEDVSATNAGVGIMEYVGAGQTIRLGPGETLQLSYLKSCQREVIRGGTVTVGADQSEVAGGDVAREKVRCDAGKLRLTGAQAQQSGAMVFRRAPGTEAPARRTLPAAEITLFGTAPILRAPGGSMVSIARLDAEEAKLDILMAAAPAGRPALHDLASDGRALTPGGLYEASAGTQRLVFRIDLQAAPGKAPAVGRLIQLGGD